MQDPTLTCETQSGAVVLSTYWQLSSSSSWLQQSPASGSSSAEYKDSTGHSGTKFSSLFVCLIGGEWGVGGAGGSRRGGRGSCPSVSRTSTYMM